MNGLRLLIEDIMNESTQIFYLRLFPMIRIRITVQVEIDTLMVITRM